MPPGAPTALAVRAAPAAAPSRCAAILALLFAVGVFTGCASQEKLTADAIGCGVTEVDIIPSVFKSKGTETAWCATCKGKRYQCATNAERSRTACRESREGDGCL